MDLTDLKKVRDKAIDRGREIREMRKSESRRNGKKRERERETEIGG